ncbi:MAG: alginate export family protein [Flavobacteriaceae bacterium]|nr:alginate export family protein [Flavobacteriaceae bacterium]
MKKLTFILLLIISAVINAQQFDLSAELRPRYENRHGFGTLIDKDADGTNFVSQRTRLNFDYKQEKIRLRVILQNIRVWGDVATMANDDKATALHEAWAEAILSDKVSFRLGRQEIVYDDHRIFGNVDWAQQARSHDAFLFKFTPNQKNRLDIGLALNADNEGITDELYSNAAGYKSFQYAWYHGDFNNFGLSFLLLNTGIEYLDNLDLQTIDYMQTIGPRLTYKSGKISGNIATYFQTGKSLDADVSASYYAGNIEYKVLENFTLGVGAEYLSGKDMNDLNSDVRSFAPLFGTNHKFNGLMDYFYVGNHAGSVGLTDIYATIAYQKDKFSAKLAPHLFSAAANVYNENFDRMDNNLGVEIDLTVGYKLDENISINAGFSKMFATDTMEILKGGDKNENNSWGWVMVTFKPQFFSYTH